MSLNLEINSTYTFTTLAPAILGAQIKNAILQFSCNFNSAMKYEDVASKYRAIYSVLPSGSPESPAGVIFHYFLTENGENVFIAEPWIDASSLVSVSHLNFTITVVNATSQDKSNIATALAHLGVDFSIADS